MIRKSRFLATTAIVGLLALAGGEAQAGAFGLRTQSATSLGAAFAGNASGMAGISSMYWNPATITMNPGYTSEYNATFVSPDLNVRPLAPTPTLALGGSGQLGQDAFIPASYNAYQFNDWVWFGIGTGTGFGSITKPNINWAGQTLGRSSRVTSLAVTPTIGIKVNDYVSVGFGPIIQRLKVRLNQAAGVAPNAPNAILEGDSWSAGYTAGVTVTPLQGTTLGVGFRSSIRHDLQGTLRVPTLLGPNVRPVGVNVNLPEQLTVGITQEITPDLKMSVGFEWMNWSRLGIIPVTVANFGVVATTVPLRYKDGFLYSVGGEYQIMPGFWLRAGVAFEQSPIDNSNRTVRLPDTDRIYASVGASYDWNEKITLSAAYSHVFAVGDRRITITPGNPQFNGLPFFADTRASADVVSASLRIRWDNPKVAEAAPIIRKY